MRKIMVVFAAIATAIGAGRVDGAGAQAPADGDLSVVCVVDDGVPRPRADRDSRVDVGAVTADWTRGGRGRREASTVVERVVGVRVASRSGRRGFVPLRAYLAHPEARGAVSVDGVVLTAAPRLLDAQAPIGATVRHRVRVEIGAAEPAGVFAPAIVWEVDEP